MRKFFIHVKAGDEVFPDEEGIHLPSVDAAKQEALKCARELLANAIRAARATVPDAVKIADEGGQTLDLVPVASILPEPLKPP
jgi:hypothetical protein